MKTEFILAVDTEKLDLANLSSLEELYGHLVWGVRHFLEENPRYRQIIPYVVIRGKDGSFATYQRKATVGEVRLSGKISVGFGGHLDLDKDIIQTLSKDGVVHCTGAEALEEMIYLCAKRELEEEVKVTKDFIRDMFEFKGFIVSDATEVDKVHLGVLIEVHHDGVTGVNEESLNYLGYVTKEVLLTKNELNSPNERLEVWTQLALEKL